MLEAELVERECPTDRQQDGVALRSRSVVEVDHVRAVGAASRPGRGRPDAEADVDSIAPEQLGDNLRVARMLGRHQPITGLDDRDRDAESNVDLGELAAGRATAEDDEAPRQLAGERRLSVRPRPDRVEPGQRRDLGRRSDRDHHLPPGDLVGPVVVADLDPAATDDARGPAVAHRARLLEPLEVGGVVRLFGVRGPVDHVVAPSGGSVPGIRRPVRRVLGGAMQQRLRRQAADVRAAPAEPEAVDDRDRGAAGTRLVGGGFAGRAGTDDDEIEGFHGVRLLGRFEGCVGGPPRTGGSRPRSRH